MLFTNGEKAAVFIKSIRTANSRDPDQTPRNAASDQGLYCLPSSKSLFVCFFVCFSFFFFFLFFFCFFVLFCFLFFFYLSTGYTHCTMDGGAHIFFILVLRPFQEYFSSYFRVNVVGS